MSKIDRQAEASVDMTKAPISDSHPVASPSRRRIMQLGVSAVPVLATLTSQSALAGQCISTSAWGSDQISNSASQAARHAGQAVDVTTGWKISAWNSNSDTAGTSWAAYKTKYGITADPKSYTFADLYAKVGKTYMRDPSLFGYLLSDKVVGGLASDDKGYFLVAQLNYAVGAKPPAACVTEANWLAIVAGTYPAGTPWTLSQISLYLKKNYIVQA